MEGSLLMRVRSCFAASALVVAGLSGLGVPAASAAPAPAPAPASGVVPAVTSDYTWTPWYACAYGNRPIAEHSEVRWRLDFSPNRAGTARAWKKITYADVRGPLKFHNMTVNELPGTGVGGSPTSSATYTVDAAAVDKPVEVNMAWVAYGTAETEQTIVRLSDGGWCERHKPMPPT